MTASLRAVRIVYGAVLLARPEALLLPVARGSVDARARAFARVLGVRQLAEAVLLGERPRAGWRLAGACVDALHALTMAAVAALDPGRRRPAAANAAVAGLLAIEGAREWRRTR